MRCIHASHAALFFFSFLSICLFIPESELFIYITFMPSCNFSLLPCCQEEADTSLSSAPLLFLASWRGVRPQGKEAKKQTKPQHNRTKAHQNQESSFALPEPKEAGPHLSVAAPVAHRWGMRPLRRAAQSWEDEPRHRDPPPHTVHPASVLVVGVVRGVCGRVCVCFVSHKRWLRCRAVPGWCLPPHQPEHEGQVPGGGPSWVMTALAHPAASVRQRVGAAVVNPVGPISGIGPVVPVG